MAVLHHSSLSGSTSHGMPPDQHTAGLPAQLQQLTVHDTVERTLPVRAALEEEMSTAAAAGGFPSRSAAAVDASREETMQSSWITCFAALSPGQDIICPVRYTWPGPCLPSHTSSPTVPPPPDLPLPEFTSLSFGICSLHLAVLLCLRSICSYADSERSFHKLCHR